MNIDPKELQQIIKEEALRLKKRMTLESEKASIIAQLNEMEECEMDEAFLGFMGAEEKARKAALEKQFDELVAKGAIGDKAQFLQKAKEDNHGGTLTTRLAAGNNPKLAGKYMIIYTPKPTTMQKLAAGTSQLTGGGGVGQKNVNY